MNIIGFLRNEEYKNDCGIYLLQVPLTRAAYIGEAKDLHRRINSHYIQACHYLLEENAKYINVEILEVFDEDNKKERLLIEREYIRHYHSKSFTLTNNKRDILVKDYDPLIRIINKKLDLIKDGYST